MKKVVKFEASWCQPCHAVQAYFDKVGFHEVERVDIENNPDLAIEHKISSVPTLLVFDENNEEVERIRGYNLVRLSKLVEEVRA